jgi:hypothetical protein
MSERVVPLGRVRATDTPSAGGKGANLGELTGGGFRVPPGFVVTAQVSRAVFDALGLEAELRGLEGAARDDLARRCATLQGRIVAAHLAEPVAAAILDAHAALIAGRHDIACAVRSSATAEDLAGASFAGQHGTYYYVDGDHLLEYVDESGQTLMAEATTSWSFVGAGLRLSMELLGPEYSMSVNTLDSGAKIFFSRRVSGAAGEDLVEKQNAEQGLMPLLGSEVFEYGYEAENRHFVRCFLDGVQPEESWRTGLEVVELLMTAYMSAEQERALDWKPEGLDRFVPAVARGDWKP